MVDFMSFSLLLGFNTLLSHFLSDTLNDLHLNLIKPWSILGLNHYIPWQHPWLMTPSAKKQTSYSYFVH